ncbi:MAG TPA: DUF3298 domain-containing protein [Rhodanobacteraceae bacterium]
MHAARNACLTASVSLILAACGQQAPQPTSAAPSASPVIAAPTTAAAPAPASTVPLPGDHAVTKRYKITITLPKLAAADQPLADALRTTADNAKRQFMQALPDPTQLPEFANRQLELLLDFKVSAQTPAFTSVRETGMQDTGGAHPLPVQGTFVFDRKAGKLIALADLFTDPDSARKALANFAHDALLKRFLASAPKPGEGSPEALREWKANMLQMLDDGTKPTSVNYSTFIVRAGATASDASPGITLVFPPYQVAPYVDGTQTVDVPSNVFAHYLKPGYAGDFASSATR